MHSSGMISRKIGLLCLLLHVSFDTLVVWGDESNISTGRNESSPKSSPEQEDGEDLCLDYQCGAYSLAHPVNSLDSPFDRDIRERNLDFLFADVSCAFNLDRVIFDNDSIRRNNKGENMIWDALNLVDFLDQNVPELLNNNTNITKHTDTSVAFNSTRSFPSASVQLGLVSEEDYGGPSPLRVPKDIQIRIYAIDDEQEFRYRSHPSGIIKPIYRVLQTVEFGNSTFENVTTLDFAWDYRGIQEWRIDRFEQIFSQSWYPKCATLELWIPNRILETTTILGPKYDYTLAIEVNGDVVDTAAASDNTTTVSNTTTNETAALLLTKRSPQKITVWNDGIGTKVIASIEAFGIGARGNSSSNINVPAGENQPSSTNLQFIDRSLYGVIDIRTDSNVDGFIQLNGSNTRASIFHDVDEKDSAVINIQTTGFRQVVTVSGNSGAPISLDGISIVLYTTEGCTEEDTFQTGNRTACITVDSNFTGKMTAIPSIADNFAFFLADEMGLDPLPALEGLKLPGTCLVPTNFFSYNCNPLSSGGIVVSPSRILSSLVFAGSAVAWVTLDFLS